MDSNVEVLQWVNVRFHTLNRLVALVNEDVFLVYLFVGRYHRLLSTLWWK